MVISCLVSKGELSWVAKSYEPGKFMEAKLGEVYKRPSGVKSFVVVKRWCNGSPHVETMWCLKMSKEGGTQGMKNGYSME